MVQENNTQKDKATTKETNQISRKPYHKPHLEKLGDLRTLTLGISGGPTDGSGGAINEKQIGF